MKEIDNANENISGLEGLILLKLSKLISRFDVIPIKIQGDLSVEIDEVILKAPMEMQGTG